jgi:hypothetical protein
MMADRTRTDVRTDGYYGGLMWMETAPDEFDPVHLVWDAYSGGGVRLELTWEEVQALRDGLDAAIASKPSWLVEIES